MPVVKVRDQVQQGEGVGSEAATSPTLWWVVVAVVVGIAVVSITVSVVLVVYSRRRQYEKARERDPYLTREEFTRRRKMSAADLEREDEARRSYIIRKSLASRSTHSMRSTSSGTSSTRSSFTGTAEELDREIIEMERRESMRLKDDWKRWEARVRHERAVSGEKHPAAAAAAPADDEAPILAIPRPSKHRTEGQMGIDAASPLMHPKHYPGWRSSG
ncbi:hypothetical protein VTK26DRAFT_1037 [Humicola hyalothermophila]